MMKGTAWRSIWTHPRETIRQIVKENPKRSLFYLAAIYGFAALLSTFQSLALGSHISAMAIFLIALIFSPLWGYIVFSVWSWVVMWTGKWLKGKGDFQKIRAAYAWSCVPLIGSGIVWILLILLFGASLFLNPPVDQFLPRAGALLLMGLLLAKVVFSIWSLVIYLNALSEVQGFSILRAIGNVIIAGILVSVVLAFAWFLFMRMVSVPVQATAQVFIPILQGLM
jgi:hypothetical protein